MKTKFYSIALFLSILMTSCSGEDPIPVNEEELITTVIVRLTNASSTITLTSRDLDGDGPNAPTITVSGNLMANTVYEGSITLLNETTNPTDDITLEVEEEGEEHQFFYTSTGNIGTFSYSDSDNMGKPIGILFSLVTGNATTGTLNIKLRHEPNKTANGVSNGDITNAGGSTDVDVTFNITVQ